MPPNGETAGIINRDTLKLLPRVAFVTNAARGGHVVEGGLLDVVNPRHIFGAALDVFQTEPLPADHDIWSHPNIHVTSHTAVLSNPRAEPRLVAENIGRVQARLPSESLVNLNWGY